MNLEQRSPISDQQGIQRSGHLEPLKEAFHKHFHGQRSEQQKQVVYPRDNMFSRVFLSSILKTQQISIDLAAF